MSSRSALQNDAGTLQSDWHKSDTVRSPNVLAVTDWKSARFRWLAAVRRDDRLSDAAQLLAVALTLDFAHHETAFCNPSIGRLSDHLRKCERTVQRAMLELRKAHWISVSQVTGRGNKNSEVTFLSGDVSAKVKGMSNVVNLSSESTKSPTNSSVRQEKSPTKSVSKPDKFVRPPCTPYKDKPFHNLDAREPESNGPERPNCPVEAVPYGSDAENEWDAYLQAHNLPKLSELNRKFSDDRGCGWEMPRRRPPHPDDGTSNRVALNFARWCALQKGFIQ